MGRTVRLHDTRTGRLRTISTGEQGVVGVYVCGPTVYGPILVGNARPFVVFSLLKRFLVREGFRVRLVINVTDINDKIYAAARERGIGSDQLARDLADAYVADTDRLGLGRPDQEPRASQTIAEMIELIAELIDRGHAYAAGGDVYFSVRSDPSYGELSHRKLDEMDQAEDGGRAGQKRDPLDFALWKAQKPGDDTAWDSPWGRGRPGWHIECSAMAERHLGIPLQIHGGGSDLVFPHHENEAAQTRAARCAPLAHVWMHNGMVRLDRAKMAKSIGNIYLLRDALDNYGRDALIMYFCSGRYRQPLDLDDERLAQAMASLRRIREAARQLEDGGSPPWSKRIRERFFAALADDFNTPRALAAVFDWVAEANRSPAGVGGHDLREMLDVFALANLVEPAMARPPPEVVELLESRERARDARDYAEADRLRAAIRQRGWELRDAPAGPELVPAIQ